MARTFSRQSTEIKNSDAYSSALTLSQAETNSLSLEDDLNFLRTKLKDITGLTNWYDATPNSFTLEAMRIKRFTHWVQKFDAVTVPAGQNFAELSTTGKPGDVIAIGASSLGAIVAQLAALEFGTHSLTTANTSKNLCEVRDSATNDVMHVGAFQIYALLQVGDAATDGNAFADTGNDQAQLSFVYYNASDVLTAVPVADMENKVIEFAYRKRVTFEGLAEHAFDPSINFAESVATMELPVTAKASYFTTANIPSGTVLDLAAFINPDNMAFGVVAATWVRNYDVYITGMLMESGVDVAAECDVYYASNTTFTLKRAVKINTVIQVIQRK